MIGQQRPPDSLDKGAAAAVADGRAPMQRFQDLARGPANVSRDNVKREEKRYAVGNDTRKRKPTKRSGQN